MQQAKKTEKKIDKQLQKLEDERAEVPVMPFSAKEFIEYKELCRDETNYTSMKDEFFKSIDDAQQERDKNKLHYEVMRFWEKAFSEQGVIKYVIANVLEHFNKQCNFYLSYLTNSKYFLEFDRELKEKIESKGKLIPYISLSGGEKRKINLAVMLGLKDLLLLTDSTHTDLLFFDEVAENIDEPGVEGLHQLLLELKKEKTIFVITHNKHLKTLLDSSKRLSVVKKNGTSTIKG
jgi:DNA repair exonuclease SbcCD ATPase subunit